MQISRERLANFEWLDNPVVFYVFVRLLLNANYQDKEWHGITIKRGQLVTGISSLSKELNLSVKQIRTALERLTKGNHIGKQSGNQYSIITICEYDSWVCVGQAEGKPMDNPEGNQRANEGQTKGNNINKESKDNKDIKKEDTIVSKKEKSPSFDVRADLSYVEEEYSDMWNEWLDYKDEIKKQYKTQVGAKKQFTAFKNLAQGDLGKAHAIIDQSMMRNWDGLFDVKDYIPQTSQGVQFPANPRHGDRIGYDWFYDAEEERWIKDKETDSRGREFNVELGKWLI